MIAWLLLRYVTPRTRRRAAAVVLDLSLVLWPVAALTFARDEPQWVLGLSFLAITFTCLDVLYTADVRHEQDGSA